jgi:hypothetical protein
VLDVLVAFGVAKREGVRFAPTAALTEYATMIPSGLESMLSLWSRTPEFLKTGEPVLRMDAEPAQRQALYAKVVSSLGAMRTARGRVYPAREVQTWLSAVGLGATRDFTVPVELGPVGAIFARAG